MRGSSRGSVIIMPIATPVQSLSLNWHFGSEPSAGSNARLQKWLTELIEAMRGRILGFNISVAHVWADQQYQLQTAGKPMPVEESYIAAIARRHNLTIATGKVKDFQRPGIKVFDRMQLTGCMPRQHCLICIREVAYGHVDGSY
jgi:predicted nucleic acid-binding protein